MERKLHQSIELAPDLDLTDWHWEYFGEILTHGIPGHRVRILKMYSKPNGTKAIEVQICPWDAPWPVRFQES